MKKKKGLDLLIEALLLVNCSYSLTAVGSGDNWYVADLKKSYHQWRRRPYHLLIRLTD